MGFQAPILVGEAPTDTANDALTGATGRRMASLAGVSYHVYLERTVRMNLFMHPVEKWNRTWARSEADDIRYSELMPGMLVLLLGSRVANAFGMGDAPLYYPHVADGVFFVRLPHPSGRNRLLNDHGHREKMGAILKAAMWPA